MKRFREKATVVHRHAWLWEPLESEPGFILRSMFGAKAVYLDGKLMLCFCIGDEPWRGMLVCTSREHHASLQGDFPVLAPHAILPKWLYLPESADTFECIGAALVTLVRQRDARLGVLSQIRARRQPTRRRATKPAARTRKKK